MPLTDGAGRGSIADAMIAIGQSLGLHVVAEGVETPEHLRALRSLGCPSAQGYLFSKPARAEEIARLARAGESLIPVDALSEPAATLDEETTSIQQERLIHNLLGELQRLTGLETTYLTRIDFAQALQRITNARNTGALDIPEGLEVDWSDTVCRRALEQGVTYTDDVRATFPDSQAARDLGLQTYVSVPLVSATGDIEGTLCGASARRVTLGPDAVRVMERFAGLITGGFAARRPPWSRSSTTSTSSPWRAGARRSPPGWPAEPARQHSDRRLARRSGPVTRKPLTASGASRKC